MAEKPIKPSATSNADRQRVFVEKKKKAGLKMIRNLWAHPDDHPRIKKYVTTLNRKKGIHE